MPVAARCHANGTRAWSVGAHATGSFAGVLAASLIARRNVDGTCDVQSLPLFEVDHVSGTGRLSF